MTGNGYELGVAAGDDEAQRWERRSLGVKPRRVQVARQMVHRYERQTKGQRAIWRGSRLRVARRRPGP
jgi:hypothetical protein